MADPGPDWAQAPQPSPQQVPDWAQDTQQAAPEQVPDWASGSPDQDQNAPIKDPSMLGAAARGVIREAAPTTGAVVAGSAAGQAANAALAGTELGARAGPWGALAGGAAGALGGGFLASMGQDWVLDKLGLRNASGTLTSAFNPQQEQADMQQHPYATEIGGLLDTLLSLGTGSGQAVPNLVRLGSAAITGLGETGQELYNNGSVDPTKVLLAAGAGAAAPVPRDWVESIGGRAAGAVSRLKGTGTGAIQSAVATGAGTPGRPDLAGNDAQGATKDDLENANDLTLTSRGVAAENPPAPEVQGAGNPVGAPMVARTAARPADPQRNYGKSAPQQAKGIETAPSQPNISVGDTDPTITAALTQAGPPSPAETGMGAPGAAAAAAGQAGAAPIDYNEIPPFLQRNTPPAPETPAAGAAAPETPAAQPVPQAEVTPAPTVEPPPAQQVTAPVTLEQKLAALPKPVKKAMQFLVQNNMMDRAQALLDADPDKQLEVARAMERGLRTAQGRRPTVNGMVANTPALAAKRQGALDAISKAVKAYPNDKPGVIPLAVNDKQALIGRLTKMVDAATAANGGQDPLAAYKPRVKPPEWQVLNLAKRVIAKPTPKNISDFITNEKLLGAGGAADVQGTTRVEADIAKKGAVPEGAQEPQNIERETFDPIEPVAAGKDNSYVDAQNELRGWINDLPNKDYTTLAENYDLHNELTEPADPEQLMADMKETLKSGQRGLVEPHETPGVPLVEGQQRVAGAAPAESEGAASAGRSLKGTPEFEKLAAQYASAPDAGTKKWWSDKADELLKNTSGAGVPLTPQNVKALMVGPAKGTTDSAPLVKRIFSPASVSDTAKAAAALIREKSGLRARDLATIGAQLEPLRRVINEQPEATRVAFMEAMDTGAKIPDPALQPLADKLRAAFYTTRVQLEDLGHEGVEFLNEYFPHMFKDPVQGAQFMQDWWGHQGSGGSLKHRTFPTIQDALKAGYKLASTDPIEVSLRYLSSMRNYIEAQQILRAAQTQGYVKPMFDITRKSASGHPQGGSDIPLGWAPLKGRAEAQSLYAPEDWARVYNAYISRGFGQNPEAGQLYDTLQHAANTVTSAELGLSAYHVFTMAKEAIISDFAKGMSQVATGDLKKGLQTMAKAPGAPVNLYKLGKTPQAEYLDPGSLDPRVQEIVDLMTKSGGRLAPKIYDPTYQYSAMGSYFDAWKHGTFTLKHQLGESANQIAEGFNQRGLLGGAAATAGQVIEHIGRAMQTVAQPIFQKYIPTLKAGAFYDALSTWLDANPRATPTEQLAMARKIGDSVDNRFGEMVQDNIFWNRALKQSAMLAMRSYSWNLGTVREIGGGLVSMARNPTRIRGKLNLASNEYDPRAAYVVAMPAVVALTSAIYQYLKTGEPPQDVTDLMAPRTGGKAEFNQPERAILPGYEKDVYGWYNNPSQEAFDKLSTAPRLMWETLTNQDYRGMPIANENDPLASRIEQYLQHVAGSLGPISIKQQLEQRKGTGISRLEQATGIRSAPTWLEEPKQIQAIIHRRNQREWTQKINADRRHARQYQ